MMKKISTASVSFLLCLVMAFTLSFVSSAAEESALSKVKNPESGLAAVSLRGDSMQFPENSLAAIESAAKQGADMVLVDVRKTADGVLVLLADENLSRMCVDTSGNPAEKNVSEIGIQELLTYKLRNSTGGLHEPVTESTVPTLKETLTAVKGKTLLLIDADWSLREDIYKALSENGALDSAVLLARGNKKEVSAFLSSKEAMPTVFGAYEGNVIWSATSYIDKTVAGGAAGVCLSAKNQYGVIYNSTVLSHFKNGGRAMINMTDPDLCGGREDNVRGWDEMIAKGYSVVITQNIPALRAYIERAEAEKTNLASLIELAQKQNTAVCSTASTNALKKEVQSAKESLQAQNAESELMQRAYALQVALGNLENRTENDRSSDTTVNTGRIVAAVLVIVGMLGLEVAFDVLRRKQVAVRRKRETKENHKTKE